MRAQTALTATRLAKARARRRPGTMWQVLEWAYRSEMVRFAFDDDIRPHRQDYGGRSMTGLVCDRLETGIISFGVSHPKGSAADADALAVDYLVETLPREDYWLICANPFSGFTCLSASGSSSRFCCTWREQTAIA